MKFDARLTELIAIGASVTANCQACVTHHVGKAAEFGVEQDEITQAVEIGRTVRRGAAAKLDQTVQGLLQATPSASHQSSEGCGCS